MKILVTGATGFFGRVLCAQLDAAGHEVVSLGSKNCDLTKQQSLDSYSHVSYDQIYHLAAWTQAGDFCLDHPGEQWIINQYINSNVLAWWQRKQLQAKLICIGTSCAYDPNLPAVEENYLQGQPIESLYTYAMTKRMLYVGLRAIRQQFGGTFLYVVPSTLYGPGYHTDGRQMHFIFDLIRKILQGKYYQSPVVLWGDGYQERELIFVDDFVRRLLALTENNQEEIVNVGTGEALSIRHFAKCICDQVNYPFENIQFDTSRYVGAQSKYLQVEKLKTMFPDFTLTSLEEGLEKTICWFLNQEQWKKTSQSKGFTHA